ncbi:DUF5683 domain-containing protein [Polaribacter aquimarinus]|uniref:DUF5683 domain-containing protein n=1 Tax=Polaribacter aquimarinus TaxID=2100726 RepID=A0A2U2JDB1_9FLAO|nr:DUF5683 domain-containing protein [Polaribacter aquimarinus]PWG06328.1 hypothetical protein DIS07_00410 [Polaribacter aquimarinus]
MLFKKIILVFIFAFSSAILFSQKDSTAVKDVKVKGRFTKNKKGVYNPLAPSKAAFYSAIFPGMGQIYNRKYWKAPIVWGAIGTSIYYYLDSNSEYKRYRRAYKLRKQGLQDEFTLDNGTEIASLATLERAQEQLKENRDMSLLSATILYVLQIVEASVNAHLLQFNTDDNLTFKPTLVQDPIQFDAPKVGLTIKYTF